MFIVTNREVDETCDDVARAFGAVPNSRGPNELRLAEVWREGRRWRVRILPDQPPPEMLAEAGIVPPVDAASGQPLPVYASSYAAGKLYARINPKAVGGSGKGRNLLVFVHGYNNNVEAVLDRAEQLEANYGVEVLPFSWPANGGGVRGVASYKSDKRDALASTGALDRCLARMEEILLGIHAEYVRGVEAEADRRFAGNAERWERFFSAQVHKRCPFTVNLMLHSMGNYLFKHLLGSSVYRGDRLVFDNVTMVAADANNENHAAWVDRIQCRGRVYITLNEEDGALRASRMKLGEQQKARLGHYPYRLDSRQAVYVDFTGQPGVGDSHAYFEGKALKNPAVKAFFDSALNGGRAETELPYDPAYNLYRVVG